MSRSPMMTRMRQKLEPRKYKMKVICSWCGEFQRNKGCKKENHMQETHTICGPCMQKHIVDKLDEKKDK